MKRAALILAAGLASVISTSASAGSLRPEIPPHLTFIEGLNHFLLSDNLKPDRAVEIAVANDADAWNEFTSSLGNSFDTNEFMSGYRKQLASRLRGVRYDMRFRTRGPAVVTHVDTARKVVTIAPPGRMDAALPNPFVRSVGKVKPALLLTYLYVDFPDHPVWHRDVDARWIDQWRDRTTDRPLRVNNVYDFNLARCTRQPRSRSLRCKASFVDVRIKPGPSFNKASSSDKALISKLSGPLKE